MHPNEQPIDHALVQSLLASQFPEWVGLPLQKVDSAGTDNAIYRLGSELAVRLPRIDSSAHRPRPANRKLSMAMGHLCLASWRKCD